MRVESIKPKVDMLNVRRVSTISVIRKHNRPEYRAVMRRAGYICEVCGTHAAEQVDHIVPLHLGGGDHIDNKQAICLHCHKIKTEAEAVERLGGNG